MVLTGIGKKNIRAFAHLMGKYRLSHNELYVGAIEDGKAAAAGVFSFDGDVIVLESVFVVEVFRRRGIATGIMEAITEAAYEAHAGSILVDYVSDEACDGFLKKQGFMLSEDSEYYRLPLEDVVNSETSRAIFSKLKEKEGDDSRFCTINELSDARLNAVKNVLVNHELYDANEVLAGIHDQSLSFVLYKGSNKTEISAILLADHEGADVTIKYLANVGGDPRELIFILKHFKDVLEDENLTGGDLVFCTEVHEIKTIVSKFAGYDPKPAGVMMVGIKPLV